jgi:hypothetical protein
MMALWAPLAPNDTRQASIVLEQYIGLFTVYEKQLK